MKDLISKYNVPVPRYTSYPAVPYWKAQPLDVEHWMEQVRSCYHSTNQDQGISLYLHLPFCESLCTYCGCNKRITKNHQVEIPYLSSLLAEWQTYLDHFDHPPRIRELHLGGGTPTFFGARNLKWLIDQVIGSSKLHPEFDFGFEGSPNNTTMEHLDTLYQLGFRRLSLGVQDFDLRVQQAINRIQSFKTVEQVVLAARAMGYGSINLDLIYGLPFQTLTSIRNTIDQVGKLRPDRIALYGYAHVPWKSPSQRGYSEADLPKDSEKRELYETGKRMLIELGYVEIGMDHFALESDDLVKAYRYGTLHRNFMGYTVSNTELLIGLGTSAISDTGTAYAQNHKTVETYQQLVHQQGLALFRGHFLSNRDQVTNKLIRQLICNNLVMLDQYQLEISSELEQHLTCLENEGLIERKGSMLKVTQTGKPFIRNVCSTFDQYYGLPAANEQVFSKAV